MAFQSTVLPVVPGIVSRPTTIPPVGDLRDNYPETFGGVSLEDCWMGGGAFSGGYTVVATNCGSILFSPLSAEVLVVKVTKMYHKVYIR